MKKMMLTIFVVLFAVSSLTACSGDEKKSSKARHKNIDDTEYSSDSVQDEDEQDVETIDIEPEESRILTICQLATVKCYYHTVATAEKKPGTGVAHIGEKTTEFWLEYTATAELGVDLSKVSMTIEGDTITITMPDAEILNGVSVDSSSVGDPVVAPNSWYKNDVEISASDVSKAMEKANDDIEEQIESDPLLLITAKRRAQELIQNYIDQITVLSGKKYEVKFVSVDGNLDFEEKTEETA